MRSSARPPRDTLPLDPAGPPGDAWGRFGHDDERGTLNLLTPESTRAAAREIIDGVRISTERPLDRIAKPCFKRAPLKQTLVNKAPRSVNGDTLGFNTQDRIQLTLRQVPGEVASPPNGVAIL